MSLDVQLIAASPPTQLADVDLLALALDRSLTTAATLMARFGGLQGLARASLDEWASVRVPPRRALQLHAALELGRRTLAAPLHRGIELTQASQAEELMRARLAGRDQEELHVIGLDVRNRIIIEFAAAIGNAAEVRIDPRDVFRPLVQHNASGAIIVHNHPSGEKSPSDSDVHLTRKLAEAGDIVGIKLVDHLIVARDGVHSFARCGQI